MTNDIRGYATVSSGERVQLSPEQAAEIWNRVTAAEAKRATDMPDAAAAISALCEAHQRLIEIGWMDIESCPKDGTEFEVIEAGSSGIHTAHYDGKWPNGKWFIHDASGDFWPSRPILFRLFPADQAEKKKKMEEAFAKYANQTEPRI